jgi:signal transduction histidine kinase
MQLNLPRAVFINIEEIKQDNTLQKFVIVTVKDTGTGIDSEMLPYFSNDEI